MLSSLSADGCISLFSFRTLHALENFLSNPKEDQVDQGEIED
jgi:hypothetical protein